jgi:hypothetical protein
VADSDHVTCKGCGAPTSSDEPPGLCPRRPLSDTQGGQNEHPPIPTRSPEGARGKPGPALASAAEAVRAFFRGNALQSQGTQEDATGASREAIRIKPDDAWSHNNFAWALVLWPKRPPHRANGSGGKSRSSIKARKSVRLRSGSRSWS